MIRTVEAIVDETGDIRLTEQVELKGAHRALVMILDEPPVDVLETPLLSEQSLMDWSRTEEDEAWSHLQ
ncbi:hypothetical protein [Halomonas sp. PR-M31]|uniref:hypothetical protein n=1 Tax=Halomonas sp. PR-M31 TaxID=1471202 RepID=UPI00065043A8|nr:hypothetical protein [Halomonas sp. PR-M31]